MDFQEIWNEGHLKGAQSLGVSVMYDQTSKFALPMTAEASLVQCFIMSCSSISKAIRYGTC